MGVLIVLAVIGFFVYRAVSRWSDRQASRLANRPNPTHRNQILRWVSGQGPDPRAVMFCDGVPVENHESPELSSLSWLRTPPPAPSPTATPTTGTSTGRASSTATNPG